MPNKSSSSLITNAKEFSGNPLGNNKHTQITKGPYLPIFNLALGMSQCPTRCLYQPYQISKNNTQGLRQNLHYNSPALQSITDWLSDPHDNPNSDKRV
jgi:hypothetical protein